MVVPNYTADLSGPTPLPLTVSLLLSRCTRGEVDLMEEVLELLETLVNNNGTVILAGTCM